MSAKICAVDPSTVELQGTTRTGRTGRVCRELPSCHSGSGGVAVAQLPACCSGLVFATRAVARGTSSQLNAWLGDLVHGLRIKIECKRMGTNTSRRDEPSSRLLVF